jgi:hypothetical protein
MVADRPEEVLEGPAVLHPTRAVGGGVELAQVGPGAKVGTLSGQEDHPSLGLRGGLAHGRTELLQHRPRDRVPRLGAIEGHPPHPAGEGSDQGHADTVAAEFTRKSRAEGRCHEADLE